MVSDKLQSGKSPRMKPVPGDAGAPQPDKKSKTMTAPGSQADFSKGMVVLQQRRKRTIHGTT
jgi:hypothetical protein